MKKVIDMMWYHIWQMGHGTYSLKQYEIARSELMDKLDILVDSLEILNNSHTFFESSVNANKNLKMAYLVIYKDILLSLSICLRCIFDGQFSSMIAQMYEVGYTPNFPLFPNNTFANNIKAHLKHLNTCNKWLDNFDKPFIKQYKKQYENYLPEIVDKFSYSKVNVCAITKLFTACLYNSGVLD